MTNCEFKKFCMEVWHYDCKEKDPSWQACDNFWFAVLVHNKAIEKVLKEMKSWGIGDGNALLHSTLALKKPVSEGV